MENDVIVEEKEKSIDEMAESVMRKYYSGEETTEETIEEDIEENEDDAIEDGIEETISEKETVVDGFDEVYKTLGIQEEDRKNNVGKYPLKINGKTEWISATEYMNMASKGTDYTKKTMDLARQRKEVERLASLDITDSDIDILNAIKSGDKKKALGLLSKSIGYNSASELFDATVNITDEDYESYGFTERQPQTPSINKEVAQSYSMLPSSTKEELADLESMNIIPESFKNEMLRNPELFKNFMSDVSRGVARPTLERMSISLMGADEKVTNNYLNNPGDFINLYVESFNQLYNTPAQSVGNAQPQIDELASVATNQASTRTPNEMRRASSQDFGKSHHRSVAQSEKTKQPVMTQWDLVNNPEAMAEIERKYNIRN